MITNINDFRKINESIEDDSQRAEKLAQLVELGKQMLENYKKAEEFAALKAEKNAEVQELLERMNKTSIIAESTLIEVYKPFQTKRLSSKEYFDFVNTSVGVINDDFKTLSESIKALSTKLTGGTSYIRTTKNTRDLPEGTLKTTESLSDIWSSIKSWFTSFKESIINMLPGMESKLQAIKVQANNFNPTTESVTNVTESISDDKKYILEDTIEGFLKPYIDEIADYSLDSDGTTVLLYVPAADVKFDISDQHAPEWNILNIAFQEFCKANDLYDFEVTTTDGYTNLVLSADTDIIDMRQYPRESMTNESAPHVSDEEKSMARKWWGDTLSINDQKALLTKHAPFYLGDTFRANLYDKDNATIYDMWVAEGKPDYVLTNEALTPQQIAARNAYSKEYKRTRREQAKNIATVLQKAKDAIEMEKKESYFNDLANTNEQMIKQLLAELNAKSVAIGDKILTLVNVAEREAFDMKVYEEKMTSAELVGDAVAKMAKALIEIHKTSSHTAGSVRHIHNTSDLPEGTFNAHFDHETKTVVPPTSEGKTNEGLSSWLMDSWKTIKGFFTSFRTASKEVDAALASI